MATLLKVWDWVGPIRLNSKNFELNLINFIFLLKCQYLFQKLLLASFIHLKNLLLLEIGIENMNYMKETHVYK